MAPAHRIPCGESGQVHYGCLFSAPLLTAAVCFASIRWLPGNCLSIKRLGRLLTRSWRHSLPSTIGMAAAELALRACRAYTLLWYRIEMRTETSSPVGTDVDFEAAGRWQA